MVTPSRGSGRPMESALGVGPSFSTQGWGAPELGARPTVPEVGTLPWPASQNFRALQGFGLSSREAQVYVTLLSHGPLGARRATELSGLHRATAYRVLAQLLARGLVRAEPGWPREYSPLPLRALVERDVTFLRDEIELRHWILRAFPAVRDPVPGGRLGALPDRLRGPQPGDADWAADPAMRVTAIGSPANSPLLDQLHGARRGVDALIRPLMIRASVRSKVAASLARTAARGVPVRIVLDHLHADARFAGSFRPERPPRFSSLEVRHFTPLGGHCYIIDGRTALRFPVLTRSPQDPDFGVASEDPDFVRAQIARFEALWESAVPRSGAESPPDIGASPSALPVHARPRTTAMGVGEVRAISFGGPVGRANSR